MRKIVGDEINSIPLLRLLQIAFIIDKLKLKDKSLSRILLVRIYYKIEKKYLELDWWDYHLNNKKYIPQISKSKSKSKLKLELK